MKKLLLWNAIGILGGGGFAWLFRDEFTTPDAAPLASPRTAEPGPGAWTVVANAANLSIANGRLVRTGAATLRSSSTYSRANLAMYIRLTNTAASGSVGFSANGTSLNSGIQIGIATRLIAANGASISLLFDPLFPDSFVDVLIVSRPSGGFLFFVRSANYGRWRLIWASTSGTDANLYAFYLGAASDAGRNDDASLILAPSEFASDYSLALHHEASPASGASGEGDFVGPNEIEWIPESGQTLVMTVNELDADNKIILRGSQTGSTITLHRMIAGAETLLQTAAQTWTIGTPYRVVLTRFNYAGGVLLVANVNNSNLLAPAMGVFPTIQYAKTSRVSGFTTASNFALWPGELSISAPFSETGFNWIWTYGDSKTLARKTQARLMTLLEESTGERWLYDSVGRSGYTVAQQAALIATDLANVDASVNPSHVIINLGTNDAGSLPAEATWKANYRIIIEAIHAKWPSATIWLAKPVRLAAVPASSPVAAVATMHGYIDGLAAEYAYTEIGFDETGLENGDGYVTYFADALHPNDAGYAQNAVLQQTAMGL